MGPTSFVCPSLIAAALALCQVVAGAPVSAVVVLENSQLRCIVGGNTSSGVVARGSYDRWMNRPSGFGVLDLRTTPGFADAVQMRAVGVLEGCLTAEDIFYAASNANASYGSLLAAVAPWFAAQNAFTDSVAAENSPLGRATALLQEQLAGLAEGYSAAALPSKQLSFLELQLLSASGDLGDVLASLGLGRPGRRRYVPETATAADALAHMEESSHCSALIKLTGNFSELFFAHDTWVRWVRGQVNFRSVGKLVLESPSAVPLPHDAPNLQALRSGTV